MTVTVCEYEATVLLILGIVVQGRNTDVEEANREELARQLRVLLRVFYEYYYEYYYEYCYEYSTSCN